MEQTRKVMKYIHNIQRTVTNESVADRGERSPGHRASPQNRTVEKKYLQVNRQCSIFDIGTRTTATEKPRECTSTTLKKLLIISRKQELKQPEQVFQMHHEMHLLQKNKAFTNSLGGKNYLQNRQWGFNSLFPCFVGWQEPPPQ